MTLEGTAAATRAGYDRAAEDYARLLRDHLAGSPVDRAQLALFAELVTNGGGGPVLEVGCGAGRITAHLATRGLDVRGSDLSHGMIAVARREHPDLAFAVDDLTRLDEHGLAGVVAWYSLIHTPPEGQQDAIGRLAAALRPGGYLLAAFQVGHDHAHVVTTAYGHLVDLVAYRLDPDRMAARMETAGLEIVLTSTRPPQPPERQPQAYLLARRAPAAGTRADSRSATSTGRS